MLRRVARDPRNLPFVLSLILALLIAPELPSPAPRPTSGWRGWYVLLYRGRTAPVMEASLSAVDGRSVSRSSATVKIDAFSEIETLPVAAVEARLDPLDPRRDAWLAGIGGYFHGWDDGTATLAAYVPATRGRIAAWLRLSRSFRAGGAPVGSWRLLEFEPLAMLSAPAAALGFSIFLAWVLRREVRLGLPLAAAGALAWLPGLLNGGPADLCVCCAALYLWMPSVTGGERGRCHRLSGQPGRTGMRIAVLLGFAAVVIATGGAGLYRMARMSASMLCLELLAGLASQLPRPRPRLRRARHRFDPVPILPPRVPTAAPFAAALAALLLAAAPTGVSRMQAPLPRQVSLARAGSRAGVVAAARVGPAGRLPGLAEAVGHAASLQTGAFVPLRAGDAGTGIGSDPLPPLEGRVRLNEYLLDRGAGSLIEAPRTVVRFDPGWLDRTVAGFGAGTVERLLVDQSRAVEVRVQPPSTALLQAVPAAFLLFVLLGAPLAGPAARQHLMRLGLWAITEPARSRRTR